MSGRGVRSLHEGKAIDMGMCGDDTDDYPGKVVWHSSEDEGPPDVGISLFLDNDTMLYAGEIPRGKWEDAGEDAARLGSDHGWWLVLYRRESSEVLGKMVDKYKAQDMIELLSAAVHNKNGKPSP